MFLNIYRWIFKNMIGKNHSEITTTSLSDYLNSNALTYVEQGNLDSDRAPRYRLKNYTDGYNINAQHSNNTSLSECSEFMKDSKEVVVQDFIDALNAPEDEKEILYEQAFYDFGRLIHSIQDFYSHTNWINQTGNEVLTWNEDADEINLEDPDGLRTSKYTQFSQFWEKLNIFFPWKMENNYDAVYKDGEKRFSHYAINKDEKGTIADELFEKETGKSGYELASEDAVVHTEQKWQDVMSELEEVLTPEEFEKLNLEISEFESDIEDYNKEYFKYRKNFNADMKELAD